MIFAARRIGCFGCTPQVLPQSAQSAGKPQHFLSGMSAPTSSGKCDVYGFPFDPTPSELSDYSSCQQYEQRRAAKWSTLAASQTLPSGGKLKRYLRKVSNSKWPHNIRLSRLQNSQPSYRMCLTCQDGGRQYSPLYTSPVPGICNFTIHPQHLVKKLLRKLQQLLLYDMTGCSSSVPQLGVVADIRGTAQAPGISCRLL